MKTERSPDHCIADDEHATVPLRARVPCCDSALGVGQPGRFGSWAEPAVLVALGLLS
jgi:hypothetical protein